MTLATIIKEPKTKLENIFKENTYKYGLETFLLMYLNDYQIILGSDLKDYSMRQTTFTKTNPCNIYFILRRPKVTVDPESVKIRGKKVRLNFIVHLKTGYSVLNMVFEFQNAVSKIEFFTEYPYNLFAFKDKEKGLMVARPTALIDSRSIGSNTKTPDLDYEVLYIGQAFGKNGNRTAIDRLSSHETLQRIYADAMTNNPDSDIKIMLANFSQRTILAMAGHDLVKVKRKNQAVEKRKLADLQKNNGLKFSEKQKINFTEAALIRYFEPIYNTEYKSNFPAQNHKSYSECYNLDIRAMLIELDTTEMSRNIYTKESGNKTYHSKWFEFTSTDERYNLFNAL